LKDMTFDFRFNKGLIFGIETGIVLQHRVILIHLGCFVVWVIFDIKGDK